MLLKTEAKLSNRGLKENYALLAAGSFSTNAGTWLYRLTSAYLVWELTKSGAYVSVLAVAEFLPSLLLTPHAGIVADRVKLKNASYIVCITLSLLSVLWIVLYLWSDGNNFPNYIIVLTAFNSALASYSRVIHQKLIGYVFSKEDISRAISLNTISLNVGRLSAPIALTLIFAKDIIWIAYAINATSYIFVGFATYLFNYYRPQLNNVSEKQSIISKLAECMKYLRSQNTLSFVLFLALVEAFFLSSIFEVLPMITEEYLNEAAESFTKIAMALAFFALIAGISSFHSAAIMSRTSIAVYLLVACFSMEIALLMKEIMVAALLFGLANFAIVKVRLSVVGTIHTQSEEKFKGQLLSYYFLAMASGASAGAALYGVAYFSGLGEVILAFPILAAAFIVAGLKLL